jgi:predicted nucleotidyltransferase
VNAALPLEALRTIAEEQARSNPSIRLAVLFGSVVRGGARIDSDADIAILGGGFWQQLALGSALSGELGREPHVVDLHHAPEALAYEVARSGLPLFEREPFDWARFQAGAASRFFDFQGARDRCIEGVRRRLLREAAATAEEEKELG